MPAPRPSKLRGSVPYLALALAIAGLLLYWRHWIHQQRAIERETRATEKAASRHPRPLPGAARYDTAHYSITSTADAARTRAVGDAVEALYAAHAKLFPPNATRTGKLALTLYADRAQFKANNRSYGWAEAYYLEPVCYAYSASDEANPYHWMTHEATHQLNRQVSGMRNPKWIEEGLATYFGTSRIVDGRLRPGEIDPDAYPIWWLRDSDLTGELDADTANGRWIPLKALVTGIGAPRIDAHVNRYYVEFWSLTHFLLHGEGGRYADGYRRLIAAGGAPADFERLIGPMPDVERGWYAHLQAQIAAQRAVPER